MKKIFITLLMMAATIGGFAQLTASITAQTNASCFSLCDGSVTVTASGGTPAYTYVWSDSQTTQTAMGLCAGVYTVTVTDNLSATTTASVTITSPPQMVLNALPINDFCFGGCFGSMSINVSGGTPPFMYTWSNGSAASTITNLCAGVYFLTVTDGSGCWASTSAVITQPPLFTGNVTTEPDTCHIGHGTATVNISGGTPPYTYMWSNLVNMPNQTNLSQGFYSVTATDVNGCILTLAGQVLDLSPFFDLGVDYSLCTGICDTLVPIPNGGTPFASYLWNNSSVNDSLIICPSVSETYSLTITDANGCTFSDSININMVEHCNTISGIFFEDLNNDGIKDPGENPLPNKMVMITPGPVYATTDANGYYELLVDTGNFTITPVNNANYYIILPATHQAIFTNAYEVDSLNDFGYYVEPHSDLRVHLLSTAMRPGFSAIYYLYYNNLGSDTTDGTVILNLDPIPIFNAATLTPTTQTTDSFTWELTNIPPNSSGNINITVTIPAATPLSTQITSYATILPVIGDSVPANNYSSRINIVTGSYDPNDKAVLPAGVFPPSLVSAGEYLNYTIRFQNTGTDTAFNVHIVDTLSPNLDVSTFEMVASSHPCNFNLYGTGIVDFIFNNILLPDSNVNELGSNGYVSYKIKPKSTLGIGDQVDNTAYIYFDFNQPVMTNTVSTLIDNLQVVTYSSTSKELLNVWPNPSNGDFMLACSLKNTGTVSVEVCDLLGKIILNKQIEQTSNVEFRQTIHLDREGIYIVKVTTNDDNYTARIIVTK